MATSSILIVDVNPESRDGLARIIKEAGFPILTAGSSSEGLAMLSSLRPQLVLLDMSLPGMDACDLIRQMRLEVTDVVLLACPSIKTPRMSSAPCGPARRISSSSRRRPP